MLTALTLLTLFAPISAFAAPPVINVVDARISNNQSLIVIFVPFSDADAADTHSATISWGDGTNSDGLIQYGSINGAHIYTATGAYDIGVLLTDSGGETTTYNITVNVTELSRPASDGSTVAPGAAICTEYNGLGNASSLRAGAPEAIRQSVYCRILAKDSRIFDGVDALPGEYGTIGIEALVNQGIEQAVDVFSPNGLTALDGVAVCLRGAGSMVLLASSDAPRAPIGLGTYALANIPGFTCAVIPEVGTVVLLRTGSEAEAALASAVQAITPRRDYAPGLIFAGDPRCDAVTRGMVYVRSAPSESSRSIGILGHRSPVTIHDMNGTWYHVTVSSASIGTQQGYIRADLISFRCALWAAPAAPAPTFDEAGAVG